MGQVGWPLEFALKAKSASPDFPWQNKLKATQNCPFVKVQCFGFFDIAFRIKLG